MKPCLHFLHVALNEHGLEVDKTDINYYDDMFETKNAVSRK